MGLACVSDLLGPLTVAFAFLISYPALELTLLFFPLPFFPAQRYHYNVSFDRIGSHIQKGNDDGLFISSVTCAACEKQHDAEELRRHQCGMFIDPHGRPMVELWGIIMDAGTGFSQQVWTHAGSFLPKDWIMAQWDLGFYITALAGSLAGCSLVIMSKGTPYTQQSYKVSDSFPFKWISKKWKEGFHVTSMATSGTRWAIVMSRNAGIAEQCIELDFMYPSEGIHRRWDAGFRVTCCAATPEQAAFVLSVPRKRPADETQETLRTTAFPQVRARS